MNSLLQTLFHLEKFRRTVYLMPISNNDNPDSITIALQRVFYKLQMDNDSVSTKELTKAFGWNTVDSFLQHDVQELNRVLIDNLEKKMKNTNLESSLKTLFEGKTKNFIKCINVDYESSTTETYYDLQLTIKGFKDIYESFDQLIIVETLMGDNKYKPNETLGKNLYLNIQVLILITLGLQDTKKYFFIINIKKYAF
jgi:ubiquitin carboxyl-terminal hydrolase 7